MANRFSKKYGNKAGADLGGGPRGPGPPPPHGDTHSIMHTHTPSGTVCNLVVTQIVTGQHS